MIVAPQSYYSVADACYALSKEFQTAYNSLQTTILETGGMAGSYQAVQAWSSGYDERASAFTLVATNFARALQHFADVAIATGYNWQCAAHKANRSPAKGAAPALPRSIPSELPYGAGSVLGVASARSNSQGLDSEFPGLYEKVTAQIAGGEIPDGDTYKLQQAAAAWRKFAEDNAVFGARSRLELLADGLRQTYGSNPPDDIPHLIEHLHTLARSANDIELTAADLADSVRKHSVELAAMRSDIDIRFTSVVVGASVAIAVTAVALRNPRALALEGAALDSAATAIAGVVGAFFTGLSSISFTTAAIATGGLAVIAGLTIMVMSIEDDGAEAHPSLGGDDPVTQEIAQKIADHSNGRAEQGDGTHYVQGVPAAELAEYVRKVLDGEIETEQRHDLRGGRVGYWDPATGAVVLEDNGAGSVFTPKDGHDYFDDLN